ncbi:hypothetical protein HMPREF9123_2898 [Neisseria bacilliformis ATCC BAA-1200]|uniref:Uncharacterized protein n=1 Tax=Neisseria bacilliformis ATCC BAA-1200 TaxID=888742 RepID=F2BGP1_9NEIS|nr:hypothetical protein HMPREF9123_2898 [Neisseria bacilliformis ATCC BAA-1200]
MLGIKGGGAEVFEGRLKARLRCSRAFRRPQRLLRRAEWMSLRKMKMFEIYQ